MSALHELLSASLADAGNGWSIGTFGAVAEFRRDLDEPVECLQQVGRLQYVTDRGGIGLHTQQYALPVAYETLSSDGETWGHTLAFCLPLPSAASPGVIACRGVDQQPLQPARGAELLFDLGAGGGHISLSVRTGDSRLIDALRALDGEALFGANGAAARALLVEVSPPRIALSPLGRIEVYAAIPAPGGQSPSGPHTHLLPKLLASGRTQSANAPIPAGLQPVLTLHPPSPWRDPHGMRIPFNERADERFRELLERFGLAEDKAVRLATETAVTKGADPAAFAWPTTRRARAQARITLRRLAQRLDAPRVAPWRTLYDRSSPEDTAEADSTDVTTPS